MQYSHVHCIGIGGAGISAVARMQLAHGVRVSGNDLDWFAPVRDLEHVGAEITIGRTSDTVHPDADLVVYSTAWDNFAPEMISEIKKRGVPVYTYPQMLGLISREYTTIAVAGTHGKTTTTAMLSEILSNADINPSVIVGSPLLRGNGASPSNFVSGTSQYFLVEACEYERHFLELSPKILIITNVDIDHLDYYHDLADIQSAFATLAEKVPSNGAIICNSGDERVAPVLENVTASIYDYTQTDVTEVALPIPGEHMRCNAAAAVTASKRLSVSFESAATSLTSFQGAWRRFQRIGILAGGAVLYDDYAHLPEEIKKTLAAFRELYPNKTLRVFFHPHLYSRTTQLKDDFAQSFADADEVVVAPIFAAREKSEDYMVDNHELAGAIRKHHSNVSSFDTLGDIASYINDTECEGEVVVTMGAGDIYTIQDMLEVRG